MHPSILALACPVVLCTTGAWIAVLFPDVAWAETWRGLPIMSNEPCSADHRKSDYRCGSSALESEILRQPGAVYGPYTGTCLLPAVNADDEHVIATGEAHDFGLYDPDHVSDLRRFAGDIRNLTLAAAQWFPARDRCGFAHCVVEVREARNRTIDRRVSVVPEGILSRCESTAREPFVCDINEYTLTQDGAAPTATLANTITGRPRVVDGDSLKIARERIRLSGIDAPEERQSCTDNEGASYACGVVARRALFNRINGAAVRCAGSQRDRYDRLLAVCYAADGEDLNGWMVRNGHALAYQQYSLRYADDEAVAQERRLGIHAGRFIPPWNWRRGARSGVGNVADDGGSCRIKGNISGNTRQRIYHLPGGRYYEQTTISPARGERWFCTEEEARAAGWRRAWR